MKYKTNRKIKDKNTSRKNKVLRPMATVCAAVFCAAALGGCSAQSTAESESTAESSTQDAAAAEGSYTGTVTEISAAALTLETEDGAEVTAALTDETTYTREGGGQPGGDGEAPAQPDGAADGGEADGTPPEKPDGEADGAGDSGQPDGGTQDGGTPPEQPAGDGAADSGSGGTPPEKPDGDSSASGSDAQPNGSAPGGDTDGAPPEKPDGDISDSTSGGSAPADGQAPSGSAPAEQTLTYADIAVGDTVTVELDASGNALTMTLSDGMGGQGGGMGGAGESGGQPTSYNAANAYTADASESGGSYTSTGTDENAVNVSGGASVTLDGASITRTSSDSTGGNDASFYGVGAAALVTDGTLTITDSAITTDADGGAGVFAYGDGVAYVSDTAISTAQGTSGGIHVAGGGTLYAWNLNVETDGASSAAIRSDRGSGTMVVDGGSYTANGSGSPAVYSTADITVNNATLTATGSEAACIEGENTIRLFDCDLSGNTPANSENDCIWNVILYQSASGDAADGTSTFEMVGGSLTAQNGGMFYTTNTASNIFLSGVSLNCSESNDFLLKCTGNANARGWGQTGANGADCTFTARSQELAGDVVYDSISTLDFYLLDGSTLTGAFTDDESCAGNGGSGAASLTIDSASAWVVTADSALTNLACAGSITDEAGRTVSIVGADGAVYVQGDSEYTVTVQSYTTSIDTSNAAAADSWSDYAVSQT